MNIPFSLPIIWIENQCKINCTYLDFKWYEICTSDTASAENNLYTVDGVYVSLNSVGLGLTVGGIVDFKNKKKNFYWHVIAIISV